MSEQPKFTALYYSTCGRYPPMANYCFDMLRKAVRENGGEIVAVTWKPFAGADRNIVVESATRLHLTLYRQINLGLDAARSDIVCLAEDDILYPASHFAVLIEQCLRHRDFVHYNDNVWHLSRKGFFRAPALSTFLSTMGADRDHMRSAIAAKIAETNARPSKCPVWGEPRPEDWPVLFHRSPDPVIDIRASGNWTGMREPTDDSPTQYLAPWGWASRYDFMFLELAGQSRARRIAGRLAVRLAERGRQLGIRLQRLRRRLAASKVLDGLRSRTMQAKGALASLDTAARGTFRTWVVHQAVGAWLIHCADPLGPRTQAPRRDLSPSEALTLVAEAGDHGVLPAVMRNFPPFGRDPAFAAAHDDATARQRLALGFSMMLRHHGNALLEAANGIEAAIIKGQVFARTLYPEPALRPFTDIDILATPRAVTELAPILAAQGFVPAGEDAASRQEHAWVHRDNGIIAVEVHTNLVHAPGLRRVVSLTYEDLEGGTESPAALLVVAAIHGAVGHHFQRLGHVVDICQGARNLKTTAEEARFEKLIARSGARLAAATGLDLAGRLFAEPRCIEIARAILPARHAAAARLLIGRTVITSAMNGSRFLHSWRRSVFRLLLKAARESPAATSPRRSPSA